MTKELIGLMSGIIVIISIIPYAIRTYQGKITPNITSWSLWSLIGLALLLTYRGSGAKDNLWPVLFGFTNPTLIAFLASLKKNKWEKLKAEEWGCIIFGVISLIFWFIVRNNPKLMQFALYTALVADLCAAIPTISFLRREPMKDRPFAWGLFAIGYGLGILAIPEKTLANFILPIYMILVSSTITAIVTIPRLKTKTPWREWI